MLHPKGQKVKIVCPPAPRSEDGSAGGGLGEECRAVRASKPRRSARILGGRNRAEISLSFLEFFSGGARKRKIVRENFCEVAAGAIAEAGGGAGHPSGLSAKKVRISSKQYRQFTISAFWGEIASRLRRSAGALRAPKPHFATDCHAPRGEKETAWFWIWKFVLAKPKAKQSFANQSFFVSSLAKHGSDNFNILTTSL